MKIPWPGRRALEHRISTLQEERSYTDAITAALLSTASGDTTVKATATAALEACTGFVGRAFASAEVNASDIVKAVLTPACLAQLGRAMIAYGEMLLLIRTDGGRLALYPAQSWDVLGSPDPMTWRYRVTLGGASEITTYSDVPYSSVIHVQYSFDNREPWRGQSPLAVARLAGRLSAETAAALADESSGPRGSFLSVPIDGADPAIAAMKADVKTAKGSMLFGQGGDWDAGTSGGGAYWAARRFGPEPGAALVELFKVASEEVYAACGLAGLFTSDDAAGAREAYRRALHGTVAPLGRLVADELTRKLDEPISLDWMELRAGDIAGRARAFQSLVGAGMDIAKAAALSGLMLAE